MSKIFDEKFYAEKELIRLKKELKKAKMQGIKTNINIIEKMIKNHKERYMEV